MVGILLPVLVLLLVLFRLDWTDETFAEPARGPAEATKLHGKSGDGNDSGSGPTVKPAAAWVHSPERSSSGPADGPVLADREELKYPVLVSQAEGHTEAYAARHAIVRFRDLPDRRIHSELRSLGFVVTAEAGSRRALVGWRSEDPARDHAERLTLLRGLSFVELAEPDFVVGKYQESTPADDLAVWASDLPLSYLDENGIRSDGVVVAVLDTGINTNHEDLQGVAYLNPAETANGKDSDGNGYIDDLYGYDFVDLDNSPMDEDGHGTAIAGAIGATGNNGKGIYGLAQGVRILNVRVLNEEGIGFTSDVVRGIEYATSFDCPVMNCSWGSFSYSTELLRAIREYTEQGGILVAAAGNNGLDMSLSGNRVYPACYLLEGILSIGSTHYSSSIASFSNRSEKYVDWVFDGTSLNLPALGDTEYRPVSGTSFSAAIMSAYLALARAGYPERPWPDILDDMQRATEPVSGFKGHVAVYGNFRYPWFHERSFFQPPVLGIQSAPADYVYGQPVQLTLTGLNQHAGDWEWYLDPEHTVLGTNVKSITVDAHPETLQQGIHVRFTSYYGESDFGPYFLHPVAEDLQLKPEFQDSYTFALGDPVAIEAAVTGLQPIGINWYRSDGTLVDSGSTLEIPDFSPYHEGGYYFVAENSIGSLKSPPIRLDLAAFNLVKASFGESNYGLIECYGNGVYLSRGSKKDRFSISADGIHWRDTPSTGRSDVWMPVFFKGWFYSYDKKEVFRSRDGMTWESVPIPYPLSGYFRMYAAGDFLILADYENGVGTRDGTHWDPCPAYQHAGGYYYMKDETGWSQYSPDTVVWNPVQGTAPDGSPVLQLLKIQYAGGLYIAGAGSHMYESTDGINWIQIPDQGWTESKFMVYRDGKHYLYASSSLLIRDASGNYSSLSLSMLNFTISVQQLPTGHLVFYHNSQLEGTSVYFEPVELTGNIRFVDWPDVSDTELVLGDGLEVDFGIPESEIDSIQFYLDGYPVERRTEPPFYEPWYPDCVGELEAFAVIREQSGKIHYSANLSLEVTLPEERIPLPSLHSGFTVVGRGDQLGLLYREVDESGGSTQYRNVWLPELGGDAEPVIIPGGGGFMLRDSKDGSVYFVQSSTTAATIPIHHLSSDGGITTVEVDNSPYLYQIKLYGDTLYALRRYSSTATEAWICSFDGERFNDLAAVPYPGGYCPSPDGDWLDIPVSNGELHREIRELFLVVRDKKTIQSLTDGREWPNLDRYQNPDPRNVFGDTVWFRESGSDRTNGVLVGLDGNREPFELGYYTLPVDFEDPDGHYMMGYTYYPDHHALLWPRNEVLAQPAKQTPWVTTSAEGLVLNVPVSLRQLCVGPPNPLPVSFDVYLSTEVEPELAGSTYIGRQTQSLMLTRGENHQVVVRVPLPGDLAPGTYQVGVMVNPEARDFPDRTHNNLAWKEWTRGTQSKVSIGTSPWGVIAMSPEVESPVFGSEASFSFTANPGFSFSGWAGDLSGRDNPAIRLLPGNLSVQAGALPSELAVLLPDAEYRGPGGWHESAELGWFDSGRYPWLLHDGLGQVHADVLAGTTALLVHDNKLGWLYLEPAVFPWLYHFNSSTWIHYSEGTENPRWFYDPATGEWIPR